MSYPPTITDTPTFREDENSGLPLDTAALDTLLTEWRDIINELSLRAPLNTNADGTPLGSITNGIIASTFQALLASTAGAANIGTLQPGATVEAALGTMAANLAALVAAVGTAADITRRTGSVAFTANQSMGAHKLTNLADGTAAQDAVTITQLQAVAAIAAANVGGSIKRNGSVDFSNDQSMGGHKLTNLADPVAVTDAVNKQYLTAQLLINVPPGTMVDYAGIGVPPGAGWLLCDGSAVSRTTYAALFAQISTIWGVGDGSTTFNVPDCRGRTSIGVGTGSGLTARTLATTMGEENHALTSAENGPHTHGTNVYLPNGAAGGGAAAYDTTGPEIVSDSTGSGTAHNTMQPSVVVTKIIKT